MELGEKIRTLRTEKDWTQPQLASKVGIEQSTLSKIESGKLIPAPETLDSLLASFALSIDQLMDGVSANYAHRVLSPRLPQIAAWILTRDSYNLTLQKRWLSVCAALIIFGASGLIGGKMEWLVDEQHTTYIYKSSGVFFPGEPFDVFSRYVNNQHFNEEAEKYTRRLDDAYMRISEYRGGLFIVPVEGGKRTYRSLGNTAEDNAAFKVLMMSALIILITGLVGVVFQWRLNSIRRSLI